MILATTTGDFNCIKDHAERVRLVARAGFRHLDLSMYEIFPGDPLFSDGWREYALELGALAKELGVDFVQAHSPSTNNMGSEENYADALWKTERSIEVCGILGIENLVVHAGWERGVTDKETWFEENRKFFRALIPAMERCGVNVLCENTTKANMPTWYYLFSGADMRAFVDYVDHPRFGACWDTGHANVEGHQFDDILAMGDCLRAIHFNDNRGKQDEHILPFMGTMNVDEVMHALMENGFEGPLTFECSSALRPKNYWLGNRRSYAPDTRLCEPPLALMEKMERLMYEMGEHILTAYGLFED